jgi:PAS domain S-box-containing protein
VSTDRERAETIVETITDGVYALDENLRFSYVNEGLCSIVGCAPQDLLGTSPMEFFEYEDEAAFAEEIRERVVAGDTSTGTLQATLVTESDERTLESRYRLYPEPDGEFRGSIGVIRDVTERVRRERTLRRQRDELATFTRITDLLLDVAQTIVETTDRDAIETAVCEHLVESELYSLAWIGERSTDGEYVVPRTVAGADRGYLEELSERLERSNAGDSPTGRAFRTGAVQVTDASDVPLEPSRDSPVDRSIDTVLSIPLQYRDTVYGVLDVCATRPDAFSDREQRGFATLGEMVGFAIAAGRQRRLLFADAAVELEFLITDTESVLLGVAQSLDCRLSLEGSVGLDERWLLYLRVEDRVPDDVVDRLHEHRTVDRARTIAVDDGTPGGRIEVLLGEGSLWHQLSPLGVQVREAVLASDGADVVVEAPADADARAVTDDLGAAFDSVTPLAHREQDFAPMPQRGVGALVEDLTDRQREALETAFLAGYFDWPRNSTAEEVAETLEISPPTFHAHVRKAERKLLAGLFG